MKLTYPQLEPHLKKNLAPIYILSSDEYLLLQEAQDLIRKTAHQAGYSERVVISTESDWGALLFSHTQSLSLFSTKQIIELDLSHTKLNPSTSQLLQEYAEQISNDVILIIKTGKLDSKLSQAKWFQALEKKGISLSIWPIPLAQLPQWITQRAKQKNIVLDKASAELIANRAEGNLLAAAQEIEKLSLLDIHDFSTVSNTVADNAQFTVFDLIDTIEAQKTERALRILKNLFECDTEPTLILWSITRELRILSDIATQMKAGMSLTQLFNQHRIFEKRQPNMRTYLQRFSTTHFQACLLSAANIDKIIKGAEKGNVADELERLVLLLV